MHYSITRWHSPISMRAASHKTRQRAPAAADALWSAIYEMLASEALLDRPVALRLQSEFNACEVSPPKRGYLRHQTFRLRPDDSLSPFVEFYAEYA